MEPERSANRLLMLTKLVSGRSGSRILILVSCSFHSAASTVCGSNRATGFSTKGKKIRSSVLMFLIMSVFISVLQRNRTNRINVDV